MSENGEFVTDKTEISTFFLSHDWIYLHKLDLH